MDKPRNKESKRTVAIPIAALFLSPVIVAVDLHVLEVDGIKQTNVSYALDIWPHNNCNPFPQKTIEQN
jgi:hypothetical protein